MKAGGSAVIFEGHLAAQTVLKVFHNKCSPIVFPACLHEESNNSGGHCRVGWTLAKAAAGYRRRPVRCAKAAGLVVLVWTDCLIGWTHYFCQ